MKALVLETPGEVPVLAVRDVPVPSPGPGDVLVKVLACGFCHHDLLVMSGRLCRGVAPRPVLGHEIAGEVVEVGPEVAHLRPGHRVVSILTDACGQCERCLSGREHRCMNGQGVGHSAPGGFAQYVRLREFSLVPVPPSIPPERACLLACPVGVALKGVQDIGGVCSGETVLVTGAGGGLGIHAVQVARLLGARVLAVTSSPAKAEGLRRAGAHQVLPASDPSFSEVALALTGDRGVDLVVDTVGSPLFPQALECLAQYGRVVVLGEVTGRPVSLNLAEMLFRDARIFAASGVSRQHVARAAELVARGDLTPVVALTLGLGEVSQAYRMASMRRLLGRAVVVPW